MRSLPSPPSSVSLPCVAVDVVVAAEAEQRVVAVVAADQVDAGRAVEHVVAGGAGDHGLGVLAGVGQLGRDRLDVLAVGQRVARRRVLLDVDGVVAGAAVDRVGVAVGGVDRVVAVAAEQMCPRRCRP